MLPVLQDSSTPARARLRCTPTTPITPHAAPPSTVHIPVPSLLTASRASLGANIVGRQPRPLPPFAGLAFPSRLTSGQYFPPPRVELSLALDAAKESLPRAVYRCPTCPPSGRVLCVPRRALRRERRRRRARSRLASGRSGPAVCRQCLPVGRIVARRLRLHWLRDVDLWPIWRGAAAQRGWPVSEWPARQRRRLAARRRAGLRQHLPTWPEPRRHLHWRWPVCPRRRRAPRGPGQQPVGQLLGPALRRRQPRVGLMALRAEHFEVVRANQRAHL